MFAEFLPSRTGHGQAVGIVGVQQFAGEEAEAEPLQQYQDARGGASLQQADVAGIQHVERDNRCDGLAVGNAELGKLFFELGARPVAKSPSAGPECISKGRRRGRCDPDAARRSGG